MSDQQTSDVQEMMRGRLAELRRDYQRGQAQLQQLMRDEAATRDGLLRTGGAIRVLEDLLAPEPTTRRDHVVDGVAPGAAP
ncbi:hypothetical protein [Streptomyces sp. NPDC058335]|uniref:hypothetical protein n=1 Tax=Streptomyces sp. NPDC058335 TaxID=3346451 RepID=UPI00364890A2